MKLPSKIIWLLQKGMWYNLYYFSLSNISPNYSDIILTVLQVKYQIILINKKDWKSMMYFFWVSIFMIILITIKEKDIQFTNILISFMDFKNIP